MCYWAGTFENIKQQRESLSNIRKRERALTMSSKKPTISAKNKPGTSTKKPRQRYREEIVFDPEARKEYLRGFSERKQKRRSYGLAMQKVKDRKAKLEQRAEKRDAVREQMEDTEKHKEELLQVVLAEIGVDAYPSAAAVEEKEKCLDNVQTYQDKETLSHWGGDVVVTTSTRFPGDSSEEDEETTEDNPRKKQPKQQKGTDEAQEYAGNVDKFLLKLKGNMPGKKKKDNDRHQKGGGKHGAANMKGMGSSSDLKIAKKALDMSKAKVSKGKATKGKATKKVRR
jgi:hypothetical protein